VVLVGGLGSSTGHAAVLDVDTKALGYDRVDTYQFSYRADGRDYGPSDTMGDIGAAGEVLRRQIERLHAEYPGVPIDVIAHSQGGLVARVAITSRDDPGVATLVTLGTPHRGTNVATARAGLGVSDVGQRLLTVAAIADIRGIDPTAKSIEQMAETSPFLSDLNRRAVPANTRVVSIAARDDPLVTTAHSRMDGASNVVVTPNGRSTLADHARLPGSPEARAEIARSLAGQRPTCHSLREAMDDAAAAWALNYLEDLVGATVTVGGILFDARGRHG
jgi:pimeloyl-ACP methyl ester carboxylesterase